ncbi:helicase [Corallococcus sp. CA054B]|uniref:DEAD/DEAH box helicase family protein n=1 Tax=Corallococcus sp. CA054B TaxID=2316734 RepID=UPI000EA33BBA|nr:DEAD/DEAH box helicase family protein [Corallococcus sp. CA054B]RKG70106.1 helicase [Corallococcus sp. CA054B]
MKLLQRIGVPLPPSPPPGDVSQVAENYSRTGRSPVGWSSDLARILALPRRDLAASYTAADVEALEAQLRAPAGPCGCAAMSPARPCPTRLRRVQALALLESSRVGGLLGPIGTGHGKELTTFLIPMVMPACRVACLFIPANLLPQFTAEWDYYGAHWRLPNLAGGRWFRPGLPVLHVITYNKLSSQEATDLLERIRPDLVILNEAHNLKDPKASRTGRFLRYFEKRPETRLVALSGTFASKSIKDYAHLSRLALREGSPLPLAHHVVEEWGTALDPGKVIAPPGALERLCAPDEHVREGFRRRRNDTRGIVATDESALNKPLIIRPRYPGPVPAELLALIELAHGGERPDGEQFQEQLQAMACARQLSAGFYHRWRYPRGEPPELIEEWFAKRKAWNKEVWEELKGERREHLDSPGLLTKAAIRAHMVPSYEGDKPVWQATTWTEWAEIHDAVQPEPQAVWVSDFLVQDAAEWARTQVGIVWVEFPELGERIARAAGVPFYGGGRAASEAILQESGRRSIVASIKAHATGKNLQQFCRNLVVTPPSDGAIWEQLLARTHRPGQQAARVEVDVCIHTQDYVQAFATAQERARFIQQTDGQPQKLLCRHAASTLTAAEPLE